MALRPKEIRHYFRGNVRTSDPAAEPVTAAELRTYLRETATGLPDAEAADFIQEARELIEEATGLALITQTWQLSMDHWPAGDERWTEGVSQGAVPDLQGSNSQVELPRYPLQSIDSVTVYDDGGNATAVTVASVFDVDTFQRPGRLRLKSGQTWPIALRDTNAVVISYISGYGDAASDVPAALVRAVKQLAAYLYSHRGDHCSGADALIDSGVGAICDRFRVVKI